MTQMQAALLKALTPDVIAKVLAAQAKVAPQPKKSKADILSAKDKSIVAAFKRRTQF